MKTYRGRKRNREKGKDNVRGMMRQTNRMKKYRGDLSKGVKLWR